MKVELVTKSIGTGRYEGMSAGQIIEAVARHGKIKDYGKLIKYLVDNKHWSPMEHMHYTFRVETSRAISAQIFRHKSLHFQELSQRYDAIQEMETVELREKADKNRQSSTSVMYDKPMKGFNPNARLKHAIDLCNTVYQELLKFGVAKECARMVLPMSSKTVIHITGNVRDLFAFLNVRCDHHAQKEVRDIATAMGEYLEKEMPEVMGNIDWRKGFFM